MKERKAQIDEHITCMELVILAVPVPHPSPPEPEPARGNAGRSVPRSSPPAGAARVRPNREACKQCGRRIGVSSGDFGLGFLGLSLSPPLVVVVLVLDGVLSSAHAQQLPCRPVTSPLHWVFRLVGFLIFVFACALRPASTVLSLRSSIKFA
jgi:hypothetical protein